MFCFFPTSFAIFMIINMVNQPNHKPQDFGVTVHHSLQSRKTSCPMWKLDLSVAENKSTGMLGLLNVAVSKMDVCCCIINLAVETELITSMAAMKVPFKAAVHFSQLYMGMTWNRFTWLKPREQAESWVGAWELRCFINSFCAIC